MGSLSSAELLSLKMQLNSKIWVLKAIRVVNGDEVSEDYWTGFTVGKGLIMCTVSGFNRSKSGIEARRIDMEGFSSAKLVFVRESWDIMLLKVNIKDDDDDDDCEIGELLAKDGSIQDGETLFSISNSHQLVGSFLIGRASYRCINNVILPENDTKKCYAIKLAIDNTTPLYRHMSHVWYHDQFLKFGVKQKEGKSVWDTTIEKYKIFHPLIPIIQCHGFQFHPTSSGAPVFNTRGEIVGMLNSSSETIDIAIHVTLMKEFLNVALADEKVRRRLAAPNK